MFLKIIKDFFLRRKIKHSLENYQLEYNTSKIKTIGIIIDESFFTETPVFLSQIRAVFPNDVAFSVLIYTDKSSNKLENKNEILNRSKISLTGSINHETTKQFLLTEFDLLLSFYDIHKPILKLLSIKSKSKFKVGLNKVNKKINHFVIQSVTTNYASIIVELIRYLKIVNKI